MSYANFIPGIWRTEINHALKKKYVFADGTHNKISGTISKRGESVTFVGIGKPTIHVMTKADRKNDIPDVEQIDDTSVIMPVNKLAVFNYSVGDIDKAQSSGNIMPALQEETTDGLADAIDQCVADLAVSPDARLLHKTSTAVSGAEYRKLIDGALVDLFTKNVSKSTYIEAIVPPWYYMGLKEEFAQLDTNNSEILRNGIVGKYSGVIIKMSNNVHSDGTDDYIQVRTKRAIGFAKPITHVEPYRPEKRFEDAVKGFVLYDSKIIRPNEMVVIKCHKG